MAKYCCFWCAEENFEERELEEKCPRCGRPYGAPLYSRPIQVGSYTITESLSRGFYGAVFRARQNSLGRSVVLKVAPMRVYAHFAKDWTTECTEHARIAEGCPFVTQITDQFTDDVTFGQESLRCHVAVLSNLEGPTLDQLLADPSRQGFSPRRAAQISADLFEILHLFTNSRCSHNDLHGGNIIVQHLSPTMKRSDAIDAAVRAVAIDFGSMTDASRSGDHHIGDQKQVARHLAVISDALRRLPGAIKSDNDYRIAGAIRGLAEHLAPAADAQRLMTPQDSIRVIQSAVQEVEEPWRQPLTLKSFSDAYNAQVLESWHIPKLWIDPENSWLNRTTVKGPQVITGMRGCGKTMLLRALHFHARAFAVKEPKTKSPLEVIADDAFVGVYSSCQKLLDPQSLSTGSAAIPSPFERLFIAYLRDAVQVLRHLRSLDAGLLFGGIDSLLSGALAALEIEEPLSMLGEPAFEQFLLRLQFDLADGGGSCRLKMAPAEAFSHLASVIRRSSDLLAQKYVLFLLDDVSTRYLSQDMVRTVISQLLFQHPDCAFKITTEAQALHRIVLSPGGSAPADPNRDYEEFNLGNEVYRHLQDSSIPKKMQFISEIISKRGSQFGDAFHRLPPIEVLGDVELETIAQEIAHSSPTSPDRKRAYRGLRALQAVCVGDLGDVIKLYDRILQCAEKETDLPVSPQKQSDCFLEHSANLMHFLNRRDQQKKNLALAFAQAAGELLQRSTRLGKPRKGLASRIRQYTKLYVRVDAGPDFESVSSSILSLLDAGVFVYDGGAPRTKTHDDDPVLQFKLSFRKLLGLASFIGLSDRDRFELSGKNLSKWLSDPENAKAILISCEAARPEPEPVEGAFDFPVPDGTVNEGQETDVPRLKNETNQLLNSVRPSKGRSKRSSQQPQLELDLANKQGRDQIHYPPSLGLVTADSSFAKWSSRGVGTLVMALGFEDRTLESARRILNEVHPGQVVLVQYDPEQGSEIRDLVSNMRLATRIVKEFDELSRWNWLASDFVIVDTSGLSKPFIFSAVRGALMASGRIGIVHTLAESYYPSNEDLRGKGIDIESRGSEIMERSADVLMGEVGPYHLVSVHQEQAEPERRRALLASASPKNDRLLHLLDARNFEATRILVPPATTPRRRVARAAAELAQTASPAEADMKLVEIDTTDIEGAIRQSKEFYREFYFRRGYNVEIGLTGSKIHAVAFAGLAAAARVSGAWYVSPSEVDRTRFTGGASDTNCFELLLSEDSSSIEEETAS
jgi:hypothetical protein